LMSNRSQRAIDNAGGRMIATHRIDCYPHFQGSGTSGQGPDQGSGIRDQGPGLSADRVRATRCWPLIPGPWSLTRLLFVHWTDLSFAIEAAVATHAMGRLRLAALWTVAGICGAERVVGAALAAAGLGVATFWIRHCLWSGQRAL
jgi:hypothetical protein